MCFSSAVFCSIFLTLVIIVNGVGSAETICSVWPNINKTNEECPCRCDLYCESGKMQIRNGYCMTYEKQDYYAGHCPYSYKENVTNRLFSVLSTDPDRLSDSLCGPYNRKGLLCGECIDGYGPAVYSLDMKCADCSNLSVGMGIFVYIILQFVPITLLFICVMVFRLNITSGPLLGYVMFCQFYASKVKSNITVYDYINSHASPFLSIMLNLELMLCECWNLEFFRPIIPSLCISEKLTNIHVLMLQFLPATYPIVIVLVVCVVMEFHRRKIFSLFNVWRLVFKINILISSESFFQTFATLTFLSSTTNLYICANVFKQVRVFYMSASKNHSLLEFRVLYYDPTIAFYGKHHLPYAAISLLLCIVLVGLPSLLLCLYPTRIYRYLSQFLSSRKRLAITAFTEALHSCFKDGLNGTRDYRALAGVFVLFVPISTLVAYIVSTTTNNAYDRDLILSHVLFITSLLLSYVRPCKSTVANISLSYHFTMGGVILISYHIWLCDMSVATEPLELTFILIPLVSHALIFIWMGYTLHRYTKRGFCRKICFNINPKRWLHRKYAQYQVLQ